MKHSETGILIHKKFEVFMHDSNCIDLYEEIGGYLGLKKVIDQLDLVMSSFDSDDLEGILSQLIALKRGYACL